MAEQTEPSLRTRGDMVQGTPGGTPVTAERAKRTNLIKTVTAAIKGYRCRRCKRNARNGRNTGIATDTGLPSW